jgi:hypothetical protein
MRNDLSPLDTALALLERGLWPVVLHPLGATITTKDGPKMAKGKEPIGLAWGKTRPTKADLRRLFGQNPDAGVGVMLGPAAGVIDMEVDGAEGEGSLLKLFGGELVETLGWSSRRGPHRLFGYDPRLAAMCKTKLTLPKLPGLEIRIGFEGKQAQSACPPTLGEDGQPRRWNDCDTIAPLPEAALQFLENALAPKQEPRRSNPDWTLTATNDASPEVRARAYVFADGFPDSIAGQHGHDRLYHVACVLVDGFGLTRDQALSIFRDWNDSKAKPRESEFQLDHKLDDAIRNHSTPSCKLLNAERNGRHERDGNAKHAVTSATEVDDDSDPIETHPWPAPPDEAVYHGLAGQIVRVIEPQTEADPLGLLIQLLVMFGNMIGRSSHFVVEATRHHTNEYAVLVGQSSQGRKGTSADRIRELFAPVDAGWLQDRIKGGLSSGEGLISAVRDPVWAKQPVKEKGRVIEYQDVMVDEGVEDKRLLVLETEFGGVLRVLEREGNKLSALIRQGWDHGNLATLTKSPFKATNAHISIIGHITAEELLALLSRIDAANGFANRFLWIAVRRSKVLPFGGEMLDLSPLTTRLADAVNFAREVGRVNLTPAARALWEQHYERLTTPPPGVLGAVTSRGAPHTLRLAMQYALLDRSRSIADDHLGAALALWEASARCAAYIFGDALGDPIAEKILAAIRSAPSGLTRTEIRAQVFQRNLASPRIKAALTLLLRNHLIREERDDATGGRPACRYYAINAVNAKSPPPGVRAEAIDPDAINAVNAISPPSRGRPETVAHPYGVHGVYGVPPDKAAVPPYGVHGVYCVPPHAEAIPTEATPPYGVHGVYGVPPDAETIPTEADREVFEL